MHAIRAQLARAVTSSLRAGSLAALLTTPLAGQQHPLDPPTWQEHWTLLEVLREAKRLDDSTTFSLVLLDPPAKSDVWAWQAGSPVPRRLLAVTRLKGTTSESVVDVVNRKLVSWRDVPGAQAPWLTSEFEAAAEKVKAHPEFVAAMAKRGIMDLFFVKCSGGPPGRFGLEEEKGRRLAHVDCQDARRVRNLWTRGIEGITVVYDMDAGKVLRVIDEGAVPVPETVADYDATAAGAPLPNQHPLRIEQPAGPGYQLVGNQVSWGEWRFHVRPDQRVGPVISLVRWVEGERERPILYEGSLSEIFVPYMDPSSGWYPRNFLDAGEYPAGGLLKPLTPALDCPDHAAYLNAVVVGDDGRPRDVPNVICIFERYAGDMVWRHLAEGHEGRPKRDLVVRSAAVLGNYDYVFDWVFQQDGTIRVATGATGIAEAKVVAPRDAIIASGDSRSGSPVGSGGTEPNGAGGAAGNGDGGGPGAVGAGRSDVGSRAPQADAYGRFVDEHIVAVNHDHYFSYRLDLDVDGTVNTVMKDQLRTTTLPAQHPRRSIWVVEGTPLRTESEGKLKVDMHHPSLWRVLSQSARNRNGYATSYQLVPGMSVETLLTEDDWPRRRAGFINHHLWVTPHRPDERYAAGMYPTLSEPGEGLPRWTAANRQIANTDLVLWYTAGMHHVVRGEDWPVMPVAWNTFELRPFDFFGGNPALRAPIRP